MRVVLGFKDILKFKHSTLSFNLTICSNLRKCLKSRLPHVLLMQCGLGIEPIFDTTDMVVLFHDNMFSFFIEWNTLQNMGTEQYAANNAT